MGWCSGTKLFDIIVESLIDKKRTKTPKEVIKILTEVMEDMDWDCQQDSRYWNHPLIQDVFKELHPDWFEEEED